MVPTLTATLGVKGHRPTVGTRDCKDLLYVFGSVNLASAALHTTTYESPHQARRRDRRSKTRRMQEAFADHLRHVARTYPRRQYPRVVLLVDNAFWHRGGPVAEALREHPHLEFYRLPPYSPRLNPIERFWKKLRRRATHNRLFDTLADLKASVRSSLSYFQVMRHKLQSVLQGRPRRKANK
jgi:hypothetical protein